MTRPDDHRERPTTAKHDPDESREGVRRRQSTPLKRYDSIEAIRKAKATADANLANFAKLRAKAEALEPEQEDRKP